MRISGYMLAMLLGCTALSAPAASFAQVSVGATITLAPPALPDYAQPPMPMLGYVWTPGWWQYGPDGYYWVPGTWVQPPAIGLLWTPGYWAWNNGRYDWNAPYWASQVGYYGGINYGYGYSGNGYSGGRWNGGQFQYNRTVNNFGNTRVANAYSQSVVNATPFNHVSFNGGNGGVSAQPNAQQLAVAHAPHTAPLAVQMQHIQTAGANRAMLAVQNQGRPPIAATSRPAVFNGAGVVASRGAVAPAAVTQQRAVGAPGPAIVAQPGAPALRPGAVSGPTSQQRPAGAPGPVFEERPTGIGGAVAAQPALRQPVTEARPVQQQQIAPANEHAAAPLARPAPAPEVDVPPVAQAPMAAPAPAVHEAARVPEVHAAPAPAAHAAPAGGREEKPPG